MVACTHAAFVNATTSQVLEQEMMKPHVDYGEYCSDRHCLEICLKVNNCARVYCNVKNFGQCMWELSLQFKIPCGPFPAAPFAAFI